MFVSNKPRTILDGVPPLSGNHSNWEHLCLETSIYYDFALDVLSFAVIAYIYSTLVSLRWFWMELNLSNSVGLYWNPEVRGADIERVRLFSG